jgi:ATP-dependent DNA helicase RecG
MIIEKARIQNGTITKQDVALKLTPEQAYSEIRKLVEAGMMYRYCGGRYTKYKLR